MFAGTRSTITLLFLTRVVEFVIAQEGQLPVINPPNGQEGFPNYCSDDTSPPLCFADCETAINNICHEDLHNAMNETVNSCQVLYLPPVFPWWRNGARANVPGSTECINNLNGILSKFGGDEASNSSYCTEFGGGGTWGWNDDGTPLSLKARYVITTPSIGNHCGQTKALWWQTNKVVSWDSTWLTSNPTAQISDDANEQLNLPSSDTSNQNPTCTNATCDIFSKPVYAISGGVWTEKGSPGDRHRIQFEGIQGPLLRQTLNDRCGQQNINNLQLYNDGVLGVIDLNLRDRLAYAGEPGTRSPCPCIADAVFEASGGAVVSSVNLWCDSTIVFRETAEFPLEGNPSKARLRRRAMGEGKVGMLYSRFLQVSR